MVCSLPSLHNRPSVEVKRVRNWHGINWLDKSQRSGSDVIPINENVGHRLGRLGLIMGLGYGGEHKTERVGQQVYGQTRRLIRARVNYGLRCCCGASSVLNATPDIPGAGGNGGQEARALGTLPDGPAG